MCGPDAGTTPVWVPPSAATIAPVLPPTLTATVAQREAFLYTGPNAIQLGVDAAVMVPAEAFGLQGSVTDRSGNPIPGVTVTIANHPEFGYTATQPTGAFNMVVNGGVPYTVTMEHILAPMERTTRRFDGIRLLVLRPKLFD